MVDNVSLTLLILITVIIALSEWQNWPPKIAKATKKKTSFYNTRAWQDLRYKVLLHYRATCMCCGASRDDGVQIHIDHILPRSKYPELELNFDNMAVLCRSCNIAKSNTDYTDWRKANNEL